LDIICPLVFGGESLSAFIGQNTDFDPSQLSEIRLLFDRSQTGVVILDEVGIIP